MYDPNQLFIDPFLTDFAVGYVEQELYGMNFFPETRTNTKSGQYRKFDRSDWLIYPDRREPGSVANEVIGRKWASDTFSTKMHALQSPVYDEERRELASIGGVNGSLAGGALTLNPEEDATRLIVRSLQLGQEKKVADTVRNTANYPVGNTVTLAGASQWNDYTGGAASTSDPVAVIQAAVRKIQSLIGRAPNIMGIPAMGMSYVENHPRVTARFQNFALTNPDAWRLLSGFDGRVVPVNSFYNAADNIDAAEVITSLWGYDVFIGYVDNADGMNVQTFGKTFVYPQPNGELRPVDRWREENRRADLIRVHWEYDLKIVSSIAGYLIKNAFASTAF
jgi:hypothetical protein